MQQKHPRMYLTIQLLTIHTYVSIYIFDCRLRPQTAGARPSGPNALFQIHELHSQSSSMSRFNKAVMLAIFVRTPSQQTTIAPLRSRYHPANGFGLRGGHCKVPRGDLVDSVGSLQFGGHIACLTPHRRHGDLAWTSCFHVFLGSLHG